MTVGISPSTQPLLTWHSILSAPTYVLKYCHACREIQAADPALLHKLLSCLSHEGPTEKEFIHNYAVPHAEYVSSPNIDIVEASPMRSAIRYYSPG